MIISDLFDIEDESKENAGWWRKGSEDSLLFDFFFTQNKRIVLGLSPERRTVSSFVHANEERKPSKPHAPKKDFGLSFSLIFHDEKLSLVGTQNYDLFMVVAQTR